MKIISEEDYMKNPGYLKLDLMLKGVRVSPSLYEKGSILKDYKLAKGIFGNCDLILPDQTWVSVPYQQEDIKDSPYKLRSYRGRYYLNSSSGSLPVDVSAHPKFYSQKINNHLKIGHVVTCHGNCVGLTFKGHRYLLPYLQNKNDEALDYYPSVDEVIAVLERIRKDRKIDVITMSSWTMDQSDGGLMKMEPYIRAIKDFFNVLLLVEVGLPQIKNWIDQTHAMGVDSVCYRLENFSDHQNQNQTRNLENNLKLLKHAVLVFGAGKVLAHITEDNKTFEDIQKDVDDLTKIKVLPLVTSEKKIHTSQWAPLFGYVYSQAKLNKIPMNEFPKMAFCVTPVEGRYFSAYSTKLRLALVNIYQSRLWGSGISSGLSNLKRRLKTKS